MAALEKTQESARRLEGKAAVHYRRALHGQVG
jgi:hypothetical protein